MGQRNDHRLGYAEASGRPFDDDDDGGVVTETKKQAKLARPRMWRVLVHNDDYTTREFVVDVLRSVFRHSESEAVRVMLHVHYNGVGVAGVYTREVAETKIAIVESLAKERDYPLRLSMEPEEPDESGDGPADVGGGAKKN